jgi:hypothetical protein
MKPQSAPHFAPRERLSYRVENRSYPACILGGDRFCDWFAVRPPAAQLTTEYTYMMMHTAYEHGVRGFDLSCRFNLIDAFKQLRKRFPEAVGVANPNWLCGYQLNGTPLWELKDRIISRIILDREGPDRPLTVIPAAVPEDQRFQSFLSGKKVNPLSDGEIENFTIAAEVWEGRLKQFQGVTDFCLVGADYADWMCALGRLDLLDWQAEKVRRSGMIPVSVSHWPSITIPLLDHRDCAAHWIYARGERFLLDRSRALAAIRAAEKPITAFKILQGIRLPDEVGAVIGRLRSLGVQSFVFGLEHPEQAHAVLPAVMGTLLPSAAAGRNPAEQF